MRTTRLPATWTTLACTLAVIGAAASLAGCRGIDKSQWTTPSINNTGHRPYWDTETTTAAPRPRTAATVKRPTAVVTKTVVVPKATPTVTTTVKASPIRRNLTDPLGVTPGVNPGTRARSTTTVTVTTEKGTCWWLTVDGNTHRGCGSAMVEDVRGQAAAQLTKTNGPNPIAVTLTSSGKSVGQATVTDNGRFVVVKRS